MFNRDRSIYSHRTSVKPRSTESTPGDTSVPYGNVSRSTRRKKVVKEQVREQDRDRDTRRRPGTTASNSRVTPKSRKDVNDPKKKPKGKKLPKNVSVRVRTEPEEQPELKEVYAQDDDDDDDDDDNDDHVEVQSANPPPKAKNPYQKYQDLIDELNRKYDHEQTLNKIYHRHIEFSVDIDDEDRYRTPRQGRALSRSEAVTTSTFVDSDEEAEDKNFGVAICRRPSEKSLVNKIDQPDVQEQRTVDEEEQRTVDEEEQRTVDEEEQRTVDEEEQRTVDEEEQRTVDEEDIDEVLMGYQGTREEKVREQETCEDEERMEEENTDTEQNDQQIPLPESLMLDAPAGTDVDENSDFSYDCDSSNAGDVTATLSNARTFDPYQTCTTFNDFEDFVMSQASEGYDDVGADDRGQISEACGTSNVLDYSKSNEDTEDELDELASGDTGDACQEVEEPCDGGEAFVDMQSEGFEEPCDGGEACVDMRSEGYSQTGSEEASVVGSMMNEPELSVVDVETGVDETQSDERTYAIRGTVLPPRVRAPVPVGDLIDVGFSLGPSDLKSTTSLPTSILPSEGRRDADSEVTVGLGGTSFFDTEQQIAQLQLQVTMLRANQVEGARRRVRAATWLRHVAYTEQRLRDELVQVGELLGRLQPLELIAREWRDDVRRTEIPYLAAPPPTPKSAAGKAFASVGLADAVSYVVTDGVVVVSAS